MKKAILITVLCISTGALVLPACMTAMVLDKPSTSTKTKITELGTDTVRAIGYPAGNGEKLQGLVLLGDKFSYWLTSGSDKVELTANSLEAKYIDMEPATTITIRDNAFDGRINFQYDRADEAYSAAEVDILNKFCRKETVKENHVDYRCRINVSGKLYLPTQQPVTAKKDLSKGRGVRLIAEDTVTHTDLAAVATKLVALPFAVAVDAVGLALWGFFSLFGGGR
jgi:hypothetical protein